MASTLTGTVAPNKPSYAVDNYIMEFIVTQITSNEIKNYDDVVILATFGFIVLTNDNYKVFFNDFAVNKATIKNSSDPKPEDLDENDWGLDLKKVFKFVSDKLSKKKLVTDAFDSAKPDLDAITTELEISFDNFSIKFNNNYDNTVQETKKNFERNFVNLAQVFYETQFCVKVSKISSETKGISTNIDPKVINDYIDALKGFLNQDSTKKSPILQQSLQVLYYSGKTSLTKLTNSILNAKFDKKDFSNYVNFETTNWESLKKMSAAFNSNIKHQILVIDSNDITFDDIKKKLFKIGRYTTIILVANDLDLDSYTNTTTDQVPPNIRLVHIKTRAPPTPPPSALPGSTVTSSTPPAPPTPSALPPVKTVTYQCNKIISHDFHAEIKNDQGINKNIITIEYEPDPETALEVLKYAVLSNVVVYIESSEN
jgi:hypothetical protein